MSDQTVQKTDINVNYTLGAARALDAARAFRDRIYKFLDVQPAKHRSKSNEDRSTTQPMQAILIEGGHMPVGAFAEEAVQICAGYGIELKPMSWTDSTLFPTTEESLYTAPGVSTFRQHLQLLRNTDIHISGPGTTMMYQQFLPDGSVIVNLGDIDTGNTMDEYMAEGAPHLRALYAIPHPGIVPKAEHVAALAVQARNLILGGFTMPSPPGSNLSPSGAVLKAYLHLESGLAVDPLMPVREVEEFRCQPGVSIALDSSLKLLSPCPPDGEEGRKIADLHLMQSLQQDFDKFWESATGFRWFPQSDIVL